MLKAYNLTNLAASDTPRAHVARRVIDATGEPGDEDVVLIKVPKGQGDMVVRACVDEHRLKLGVGSFSVLHPLAERLAGSMLDCPFHAWCRAHFSSGPRGLALGLYEAEPDGQGGYDLTRIPA